MDDQHFPLLGRIRQKAPRRRPDVTWMRVGDSKRKSGPASESHLSLPREGAVKVKERESRCNGAPCVGFPAQRKKLFLEKRNRAQENGNRSLAWLVGNSPEALRPGQEGPAPAVHRRARQGPRLASASGTPARPSLCPRLSGEKPRSGFPGRFRFSSANTRAPLRAKGLRLPQRDALCQPGPQTMGSVPRTETRIFSAWQEGRAANITHHYILLYIGVCTRGFVRLTHRPRKGRVGLRKGESPSLPPPQPPGCSPPRVPGGRRV